MTDYDKAVAEVITSKADYLVVTAIRDMFTYQKVEVPLSATELAKELGVGRTKVINLVKGMVAVELIKRVRRGVYRFNPFMYLPYRADAEELQREWKEYN